jgi:GSCFA family
MSFRTILRPQKSNVDIEYKHPIFTIGSCFAENMGQRLAALRLNTLCNPFGILYNPISIAKSINLLVTDYMFTEDDIFEHGGLWHSWQHHGRFSHPDKEVILRGVNECLCEAQNFIKKTNRLIITLGSAYVYVKKDTGETVANCHKVPASFFEKKRLSVEEIVNDFSNTINLLKEQNADLQILMTVSPVRYMRDGIVENQKSKAILLLAIEALCEKFTHVHYFPAYELVMDDLRDYRFYEEDMVHPNKQAIDYIWAFFKETYCTQNTLNIMVEVEKINAMLQHRPLHPNSQEYQQFVDIVSNKLQMIQKKYPFLNFDDKAKPFQL